MKHKVVINTEFGGFSLSEKALQWLKEKGVDPDRVERHDPLLVECIETLGKEAAGYLASPKVVEIEGDKYQIREYDGSEWIETPDSQVWIEIK